MSHESSLLDGKHNHQNHAHGDLRSDLHLFDGFIPTMEEGDILGHEFMGIVEEVGKEVNNLQRGDRVVVPFTIACGKCEFCRKKIWSACDNTNPNAHLMEAVYGYSGSGLFGYSHMMGAMPEAKRSMFACLLQM